MESRIAIVGMACIYPDANSPNELWENVLAKRRAFRAIPAVRLRSEDYHSTNRQATDLTYAVKAAVIEGYEFDRERFRVVGSTYRSTDIAHWLALDVASKALEDAGFPDGKGLPKETTGVLVGNTLTGEFSRAAVMRLRWPYVRRVLNAKLTQDGLNQQERADFINELEGRYKAPFPQVGDETLAGGLSNTIAGRICNHYDFGGGGYTIDGACSSSLLAVSHACTSLMIGDLDVAIAGGVDLSLDPFELVGFSRLGALADGDMRVYDARPTGFLPGEGCGLVMLMRESDAIARNLRIYAVIRGWGVSSDGSGGLTRPEVGGQRRALDRAYQRAGYGVETVSYFEGHGTGTAIGDEVELKTLSSSIRDRAIPSLPAVIGSIKANIGHTKAAAGAVGLLKAALVVDSRLLPPNTGIEKPHPEFMDPQPVLRVLQKGETWPEKTPVRAGVSSMGFGGINVHLTLEGSQKADCRIFSPGERNLMSSDQDAELILLGADTVDGLRKQVSSIAAKASALSIAEVTDLAVSLSQNLAAATIRAAIVTSSPSELHSQLITLSEWLHQGEVDRIDNDLGIYLGSKTKSPHIGFLFTGQGSPANLDGGALRRRFDLVDELYNRAALPTDVDGVETSVAQPAIVTASTAAMRILEKLGINASVGIGHSLGELTAYHWAGVYDADSLLRLARARGRAMSEKTDPKGSMASIGAGEKQVQSLLVDGAVIAGLNAENQTVISGEEKAVAEAVARAEAMGIRAAMLPVSHAFHSPLMEKAIPPLVEHLNAETFTAPTAAIISTITGSSLTKDDDLKHLLAHQMTHPVRFMEAVELAEKDVDLFLEVGPGQVLASLAAKTTVVPIISIDAGGASMEGLLKAVGAAFVLGSDIHHQVLFENRFSRPFDLNYTPRFFTNPCEEVPVGDWKTADTGVGLESSPGASTDYENLGSVGEDVDVLTIVKRFVADKTELPLSAIADNSRLLDDLHLNSIAVSQIVTKVSKILKLPAPLSPNEFADATVAQVAEALENLRDTCDSTTGSSYEFAPAGVDTWVRRFTVDLIEESLPTPAIKKTPGTWLVFAPPDYKRANEIKTELESTIDGGYLICLPPNPDESHIELLLKAGQTVLEDSSDRRVVFVQHDGGAAAFARTLHLEGKGITTCVVDCPMDNQTAKRVVHEAVAARGYTEAHYDSSGTRRVPVLKPVLDNERTEEAIPLDKNDLLLVTGGGKGIAAESAAALAEKTGAKLLLMGRSKPEQDAELKANLSRMRERGIWLHYISADVTDTDEVREVLADAQSSFGPITGFLHGAGVNVPRLIRALDSEQFHRTVATKVRGAQNVLSSVDKSKLRLFVTFGSIIARTGLRGEADYAVANEWLTMLTEQVRHIAPNCRCLAIEWSVWSGVGMGERLGRIESLAAAGITPITSDMGIKILEELIAGKQSSVSVVVSGRFGNPPTLKLEQTEIPLLRFLEHVRVHYPNIELVVDADLSLDTDPYVNDHSFHGERLLPAVMGLEAMAQAAMAVVGSDQTPVFERAHFERPITVPEEGKVTIRIAAIVRESNKIDLVIRCSQTNMAVDHFRAVCNFEKQPVSPVKKQLPEKDICCEVALCPTSDLYGDLLFHGRRFQRLSRYRFLRAKECLAELTPDTTDNWYGQYLPSKHILGDPAIRDAAIHSIQACVPDASLLPVSVDRIEILSTECSQSRLIRAVEQQREGNIFTYDMEVADVTGTICERWTGLKLQIVAGTEKHDRWVPTLLGPYLERRVTDLVPGVDLAVAVDKNNGCSRSEGSRLAIQRAIGKKVNVLNRPDGKPTVADGTQVSATHAGDLTMAVASSTRVGCDLEMVVDRSEEEWRELLGKQRYDLARVISLEAKEDIAASATRVWTATECLKKAGAPPDAPLLLSKTSEKGWILLNSGNLVIATCVTTVRSEPQPLALAILTECAATVPV